MTARRALRRGKSLLPAGVARSRATSSAAIRVVVRAAAAARSARGLSAYSAADMRLIAGHKSGEIARLLGYRGRDEIIHRDDLVVTMTRTDAQSPTTSPRRCAHRRRARARRRARWRWRRARAKDRGAAAGCRRGARCARAADPRRQRARHRRGEERPRRRRLLDRADARRPARRGIAKGLEDIATLPDPVGQVLAEWTRPNGLEISRVARAARRHRHHLRERGPT